MKLSEAFCAIFLLLSSVAFAREEADRSAALVDAFGTPKNQWIFNHICVPGGALPGLGYTNRDFVNAYLSVAQIHWTAALAAKVNGNENASMRELAKILHSITDAYWPDRLQRDASGAIMAFKDCESLGNLAGMLSVENSAEPDVEIQKKLVLMQAAVIARWKNSRPFDEVKPILESGPMKLSAERAGSPLLQRPGLPQ